MLPRNGRSRLLALWIATAAGCRSPTAAKTPEITDATDDRFSGSLTTRYRGRWSTDDEDHDLFQAVDANYDDSDRSGLSAHLLAQAFWDIDGTDTDDPFFSLQDTFDSQLTARLYHAYLDVHRYDTLTALRVGRQVVYDTPVFLYFDGLQLETRTLESTSTRVGAYGGIPTHPYESSSGGDLLAGLYTISDVWKGGVLRADWMHIEDENLTGDHADDLFGLQLSQNLDSDTRYTNLTTAFTALESDERDLRLSASHHDTEKSITFDASYYELFETQRDLAVPLDPFYSTLFELYPYYQVTLLGSKAWDDWLLQLGYDVRRVSDSDDVGEFNRDFERYYVMGTATDLLPREANLSLTGEVWNSDGNDIQTWGLDVNGELDEDLEFSIGSFYSLFKYDYFLDEERDDVRTYYAYVVSRRWEDTRVSIRYEFEDNDLDDFHRLTLAFSWFF